MKKISHLWAIHAFKFAPTFALLFLSIFSYAQSIEETFEEAEWKVTSTSSGGNYIITTGSKSSTITYYSNTGNANTSTKVVTAANAGTWWYSRGSIYSTTSTKLNRVHSKDQVFALTTSGYIVTPITSGAVVAVTFWSNASQPLYAGFNTNTDAIPPTYNSTGTATMGGFTYMSQSYASLHTAGYSSMQSYQFTGSFSGPCRFGIFNGGSSIFIDDITVIPPTGTPPTVTTNSIIPGKNTADINVSVTPGTLPLLASGVIWNTTNAVMDTSLATKTKNIPATTGSFSNTAKILIPGGTQYYGRAYVIGLDGNVFYGAVLAFNTLPATIPTLITNPVTNILSNKATGGGNTIDSGGVNIIQKGVCWSTTINPTIALTTKTNDGVNGNDYTSLIKGLTPNTTYHVRAYATNSVGINYGNDVTFTTGAPVPVLTANPSTLSFGNVPYNSSSPILSYALSGNYLSPAVGTVDVHAPTGYQVSTNSNSGFGTTATVSYTGSSFTNKNIYVKLATSTYGNFDKFITHTGGGTIPDNTDTAFLKAIVIADPTVLTNSGTDFWMGFGYQERMDRKSGDVAEAKLSVYVAAGPQDATVTIEMPGIPGAAGYPQANVVVPANTVKEFKDFPTGSTASQFNAAGSPDARLYYTGITKRGIHVYSTNGVPVSVWMHTYANNNSAAAAMIFPTNTWNSSYTVQAYGGQPGATPYVGGFTNNSNPNSFFFVVAQENNTPIWITPSQDILDSSAATMFTEGHTAAMVKYQKGITYGPIMLNKGQIFNAMGFIENSAANANGLDLTGSIVKTNCDKKIAVFGGNGRCLVNASNCSANSGSDHMVQQMFPKVAWGSKYLTVPTKTMEYNVFRIIVDDPTTKVWVNDPTHSNPPLTGIINNLYYQLNSKIPNSIESDKPINVTQFIAAGGCAQSNGAKGNGDPEMIILSPVQQAITSATVYSAPMKTTSASYNGHYINVVIKKAGIPSFRLDGLAVADTGINQITASASTCYNASGNIPITNAFIQHPYDTGYYFAKFKVTPNTAHTIKSDYTFNAMAYGMGDGESYGYNAGTAINNLSSIKVAINPYGTDTSSSSIKTCVGNSVKLQIALPYFTNLVDSIMWDSRTDTSISPNAYTMGAIDPTTTKAKFDGTIVIDGRTFYLYSSPYNFTFSKEGIYYIKPKAYGTFISECGGVDSSNVITVIVGKDQIGFTATPVACGTAQVNFTDQTQPFAGTTIQQWTWTFGDTQTYTSTNTANPNPVPNPHQYPPISGGVTSYWAKLETRNSVGCTSLDSVFIDLSFNLKAKFTVSNDTICPGTPVTFADQSTANATEWNWDWNDGTPNTIVTGTSPTPAVTHTFYNNTNADITRNVKLFVKNAGGCTSAVVDTNIIVRAKPATNFATPTGICLGGGLQFTNNSPTGSNYTYAWNFGDPTSSSNTSAVYNPVHTYNSAGPFTVTLTVTNTTTGCDSTISKVLSSTIYPLPFAVATTPPNLISACLKDTVLFQDGSTVSAGSITGWQWVFASGDTSFIKNPTHPFFATGNVIIKLKVTTDQGCVDDTTYTINIKPLPNITFNVTPSAYCLNATNVNLGTPFSNETTGMSGGVWTYSGTGVTGNTFSPSAAGINGSPFTVTAIYKAPNGCSDSATQALTVVALPVAGFTVSNTTCEGAPITFTDTSKPAGGIAQWEWNFDNGAGTQTFTNNNPINITYSTAVAHNVTLVVTSNAANGSCKSSVTTVPVTVHSKPVVNFTLPTSICLPAGDALFTNTSTVADDPNFGSYWLFDWPSTTASSILKNGIYNYTTKKNYDVQLEIKSQFGCVNTLRKTLPASSIHDQTVASFTTTPAEVCLKSPIRFVNTTSGAILSSTWALGNGDTIKTRDINAYVYPQAGSYPVSLVVVDANSCPTKPASGTVTVHSYPTVDAGPNIYVSKGYPTMLTPIVSGATNSTTYAWTPATYLNDDSVLNPICSPLSDQMYKITVTTPITGGLGCSASDSMYVFMLKDIVIPTAFSPNGDGINDRWVIGELNRYNGATLEVFNRQGQRVFSSLNGNGISWDGTMNGKPLPVGTYYYIIDPKNNRKTMMGYVTILR